MLFSKTTKLTTAKVSIGALSILTLGFQAVKVSALDGLPPGPAPGIPAAGWLDPTKAPGYGVNPEGGTVWPTGNEMMVLLYESEGGTGTQGSIFAPLWGPDVDTAIYGTLTPPDGPSADLPAGGRWTILSILNGINTESCGGVGDLKCCDVITASSFAYNDTSSSFAMSKQIQGASMANVPDPRKAMTGCPWANDVKNPWNYNWVSNIGAHAAN